MIDTFFGKDNLAALADKGSPQEPIKIDNIEIKNPNDVDDWLSKAFSASPGLKEKILLKSIQHISSLPLEYQDEFRGALMRNIAEAYGSTVDFWKSALANLEDARDIQRLVQVLYDERIRGEISHFQFDEITQLTRKRSPIDQQQAEAVPQVQKVEENNRGLSEEKIKEIKKGVSRRGGFIDEIDEAEIYLSEALELSYAAEVTKELQENLAELKKAYKATFNEDFPEGEPLMTELTRVPKEVGIRFDAHGIARGEILESLINLLTNGVDPNREFHTTSLLEDTEGYGIGAAGPFADEGVIVVGPVNSKHEINRKFIFFNNLNNSTKINYVILDRKYYFAIPDLEKAFPNVKFVRSSDLAEFMTEEVRKADSSDGSSSS